MASSKKPNCHGDDNPGNQKNKTFTDADNYFEDDEWDYGQINVMTANGKIISLEVNGLDTIESIKLQIEAEKDIPCHQQELMFDGKILQNKHTLANLRIKKESTLKLMRNSKGFMNIFIKSPCNSLISSLEVKRSNTIGDVKAKLPSGAENLLIFNEIVLDDSDTLADVNITNGSTLTLIEKSVESLSMEIFVNTYTGKTITLLVNPTYTITQVKLAIGLMEQIPVDEQVLIFNELVLGDSGTLSEFHIKRNSTITLMHKSRAIKKTMQIFIKMLNGKTITRIFNPLDTVADVKAKIQDQAQIPHAQQELIFKEIVLHNIDTLDSYNITNKSTLSVMRISWGFKRIFINNLAGKTISLNVEFSDTVKYVKTIYQNIEGIPLERQRLIFGGKTLEDHRILADYHISTDSTVLFLEG